MPSFNTYKYCNADKFPIKVGKGPVKKFLSIILQM